MVKLNETLTVTGASVINTDDGEVQVAFMNANIPKLGQPTQGRTIQNKEVFEKYKSEVLKDFAAFDEYVYNLISKASEETSEEVNQTE